MIQIIHRSLSTPPDNRIGACVRAVVPFWLRASNITKCWWWRDWLLITAQRRRPRPAACRCRCRPVRVKFLPRRLTLRISYSMLWAGINTRFMSQYQYCFEFRKACCSGPMPRIKWDPWQQIWKRPKWPFLDVFHISRLSSYVTYQLFYDEKFILVEDYDVLSTIYVYFICYVLL